MSTFKNEYLPSLLSTYHRTKGIVIDLRWSNAENFIYSLSSFFLPHEVDFAMLTVPNFAYPGMFTMTQKKKVGGENPDYYQGHLVILINENTQSHGEYTAMAFRTAPNAILVGSTTAGADGNVSKFDLPGNLHTMITGLGVYYPDGTETQRSGLKIDTIQKITIEGIRDGRDELLDKAIDIITAE